MSRTRRGGKGPGYDYWTRRHPSNGVSGHGRFIKNRTHKYERQQGKAQVERLTEEHEEDKARTELDDYMEFGDW